MNKQAILATVMTTWSPEDEAYVTRSSLVDFIPSKEKTRLAHVGLE